MSKAADRKLKRIRENHSTRYVAEVEEGTIEVYQTSPEFGRTRWAVSTLHRDDTIHLPPIHRSTMMKAKAAAQKILDRGIPSWADYNSR